MELKEFVKETLLQITKGVKESQDDILELGGFVNPSIRIGKSSGDSHVSSLSDGQNIYTVDFDIAISIAENTGTKADGKLSVASIFSAGASTSSSEANKTLSKISFKIPLALPVDSTSRKNLLLEDAEKDKLKRINAQKLKKQSKTIL